jgi:hypothetical protein
MNVHAAPGIAAGILLAASLVGAWPSRAAAGPVWEADFGLTLPYNVPTSLEVEQAGQPDLRISARYESRPLEPPITWQARVGRWSGERAWELEIVHHKIYLQNPPPEVESFGVSHGFNLLTLQHGWEAGRLRFRTGGGVVVAHPENTVRGRSLPERGGDLGGGYYVAGPTLGASVGRPFALGRWMSAHAEAKLALSYASVPVVDGHARFSSVLIQIGLLFGGRWPGRVVASAAAPCGSLAA